MNSVCLLVFTDGRQEYLTETLASLEENLPYAWSQKIIVNDSLNNGYRLWLQESYPDYQIHHNNPKAGFNGTIQNGWKLVDSEFVFHLEEDFTFNRHVPLDDMIAVLQENPYLVQLCLKRGPVYQVEWDAGGIVERWPDDFEDVTSEHGTWAEHRRFYSTNPSVFHRSLTENSWPDGELSELTFSNQVLADEEKKFAYWGAKFEEPWVTHIGKHRPAGGTGY